MMQPEDSHGDATSRYDIAVLNKAIDVLEYLADGKGWSVAELSAGTGLNKATVYRIAVTLERRGYVRREQEKRGYIPGPSLLALSRILLSSTDLTRVAHAVMAALQEEFGETVNLGVLDSDRILYLDMLESEQGLRTSVNVGSRDHIHSTALGKAILGHLPPSEARRLLSRVRRERITTRTLVDLDELTKEMDVVRAQGYAVDREENELGAHCIGAAILDKSGRPFAAISLSGPAWRLPEDMIARVGERLCEAAKAIELALGFDGRSTADGSTRWSTTPTAYRPFSNPG